VTSSRGARLRAVLAEGDSTRAFITVMLAVMTFVTSVVILMQFDASSASASAERQADAAALERSEADASGDGDQIIDYGMYRAWYEEIQRANWAAQRAQTVGGADASEPLLAALYQSDTKLAEWVRSNSALLQPPFFDAQTYTADFIGYVADRAAPSLRAGEHFNTANSVADQQESRSATFVALLTVLAASLFFLGLAATISGLPRRVLIGAGLGFALVGSAGSAALALQSVHRVGEDAMEAVVHATAEAIQGAPNGSLAITDAQRTHAETAIAAAAQAVALDPAYPGAWRSQGETNLAYASALYFSTAHPDVMPYVTRAIEGYRHVVELGQPDYAVLWNLGWGLYVAGDLQGSLAATDAALKLAPDQFTLYLNRSLAELALGQADTARASVETGLDVAARSGLGSNGSFFAESDFDIGRLAELLPDQAAVLRQMLQRVREAEVSISINGQAREPASSGTLSIASISPVALRGDGSLAAGAPLTDGATLPTTGTAGFRLTLTGTGVAGQPVAVRVRRDGLIDNGYSQLWSWPAGGTVPVDLITPFGRANFDANPGHYEIEIYLTGNLAGKLTLTVAPAGP
jgi:tetratricopeptide (TPR) repeat protein